MLSCLLSWCLVVDGLSLSLVLFRVLSCVLTLFLVIGCLFLALVIGRSTEGKEGTTEPATKTGRRFVLYPTLTLNLNPFP